jgi:hypothetical protein
MTYHEHTLDTLDPLPVLIGFGLYGAILVVGFIALIVGVIREERRRKRPQ